MQRWMISNYDVEFILTTLNDLYYVESFVLTWIFCTCNVERVWLCWKIYTVVESLGGFNETSSCKISPGKLPRAFLSHENPNNEHCPVIKPPFVETPPVIIVLQQMKNRLSLKSRIMKIKGYWYSYFTKI